MEGRKRKSSAQSSQLPALSYFQTATQTEMLRHCGQGAHSPTGSDLRAKDKERQLSQTHTARSSLASRLERIEADQVQSSLFSVSDQDQYQCVSMDQLSV